MKQSKNKSRICSMFLFVILILYCILCLYYEYNYLDLGYLFVVVVSFIRFLYLKELK
jgi:hypothetical protein